jgi:CMP-N-acetylneuraminic acid synthetase
VTVLGLIPARGGSKGVVRKNLRRIGGRSLIARAVEAMRGSGAVDCVLVSTEDEEIAEEARRAGAEVPFLRPPELAADDSPMVPVIEHAIARFEERRGAPIATLVFGEPTLPFRTAAHVRAAVERFRQGDCRSVISICPLERKPHNIFVKKENGLLERYIREPREVFVRRQDMAHLCRLSSGVYVVGRDDFLSSRTLIVEPVGFTEMSATESINIDGELELMLAELVAQRHGL